MSPQDPRHGTTRGFHAGCRDLCCRRAYARYEKRGKVRRARGEAWAIPALGAQRRIQALIRLGWTSTDIAQAAGWGHRNLVLRILRGQNGRPCQWVERKTHETISAVYDRLSMSIPPDAPHRARSRTMAARRGWLPPLAWDDIDTDPEPPTADPDTSVDPVVVMRLLEGHRVTANHAEKEEALARWVYDGGSKSEFCDLHGWNDGRFPKVAELRLIRGGAA